MSYALVYLMMVNLVVLPIAGKIMQDPVVKAAQIARTGNYDVVMWGRYLPSFMFYAQRFVALRDPRPGDIVLTETPRLRNLGRTEVLFQENGIALARVAGQ
jgi:hypothetical protein